jgi:hypothetical protein
MELVKNTLFAAALLDIRMPDMDAPCGIVKAGVE